MSEYQDLQNQIAELQRRAAAIREKEREEAVQKIKSLMATFAIGVGELASSSAPLSVKKIKTKTTKKAASKYRDANGNEWSGRGLQPRWLRAELAKGTSLESFLIAS
jgi:DNA-binding protein H-NS